MDKAEIVFVKLGGAQTEVYKTVKPLLNKILNVRKLKEAKKSLSSIENLSKDKNFMDNLGKMFKLSPKELASMKKKGLKLDPLGEKGIERFPGATASYKGVMDSKTYRHLQNFEKHL